MSHRSILQSCFLWTVLTVLVLIRMPLAAQTVTATSAQKKPREKSELTRPTRFNITSSGGTGLVQAVSPYTLGAGEGAVGPSVMNFDRDPGDIDIFEFGFQGAVGLPKRTEFFVRVMPWLSSQQCESGSSEISGATTGSVRGHIPHIGRSKRAQIPVCADCALQNL